MTIICGVDGCKRGWVVLMEDLETGQISWHLCADVQALVDTSPAPLVTAVDIPIGLPLRGARRCDQEARRLLGSPRGSSVFPAPIRPVLRAATYEEACDTRFAIEGKKLSKQAWAITPRIRAFDDILGEIPALQARIREVHPEVSFYFLAAERPMQHSKKRKEGRAERRALLEAVFGSRVDQALAVRRQLGSAEDDILDAFACLWTARRIIQGHAHRLPAEPTIDAKGLRMEIVA